MGQILITKINDHIVSAYHDGREIKEIRTGILSDELHTGDICTGYVENIVNNIHAAFVRISHGVKGYVDIEGEKNILYLHNKNTDKLCAGDKILVQVAKEPIKSKPVSVTSDITLSGKFVVLLPRENSEIKVSNKITDPDNRQRLLNLAKKLKEERGYAAIFRTNAADKTDEEISLIYNSLADRYERLINEAMYTKGEKVLLHGQPPYLTLLQDISEYAFDSIYTDDKQIYDIVSTFLDDYQPEDKSKLKYYDDEKCSLSALFGIKSTLDKALNKNVWLKSGAYLVIEYTEAMTVIDVNSGKAIKGKNNFEQTALKINLEAAEEIANQLRLRNLSGMIIIDFISMKDSGNNELLLDKIRDLCKNDPVKTVVLDITALGLVEMTRKRMSRPLYDAFRK